MKKKRFRAPIAKPGDLKMYWGKVQDSLSHQVCGAWGDGSSKRDLHLLFGALCEPRNRYMASEQYPSIVDELIARGYDITTLKFSIQKIKTGDDNENNR